MNIISFMPLSYNVKWDGESYAMASIELPCHNTAATYSAEAFPVASAATTITVGPNTSDTYTFRIEQGDRLFSAVGYDGTNISSTLRPAINLPVTVSSGVATIVFSNITATTLPAHAWSLKAVKNTTTHVLLRGRVDILKNNPYIRSSSTIYTAGDSTAFGCF